MRSDAGSQGGGGGVRWRGVPASAATMKKDSGIVLAPHDIAPNDMPGKMKKLFTCPGSRVCPLTTSSKKRVPEPKMALPLENL